MNARKFFFKTYEKTEDSMTADELIGDNETHTTTDFPEDSTGTDRETPGSDQPNKRKEDRGDRNE